MPDPSTYRPAVGSIPESPGVYRFRDYPPSPREEVAAAWLAVGQDVAVVSHESALDLWDLSDVIPGAVHLTVPRAQRSLARPFVPVAQRIDELFRRQLAEISRFSRLRVSRFQSPNAARGREGK